MSAPLFPTEFKANQPNVFIGRIKAPNKDQEGRCLGLRKQAKKEENKEFQGQE